jgi:hypothetical protein
MLGWRTDFCGHCFSWVWWVHFDFNLLNWVSIQKPVANYYVCTYVVKLLQKSCVPKFGCSIAKCFLLSIYHCHFSLKIADTLFEVEIQYEKHIFLSGKIINKINI